MSTPLPFGLPGPTAFYLTLYLVTLALHWWWMQLMLGGSLLAALRAAAMRERDPLGALIHDWQPFVLSLAITAGVAPLLFVQVLYQEPFYTANLLLAWRVLLLVPALIVAFYVLYVLKSGWADGRPRARRFLPAVPLLCFALVAWIWIANHQLSLEGAAAWREVYLEGQPVFADAQVVPRLLFWLGLSVPIAAWAWLPALGRALGDDVARPRRQVALAALLGLAVAVAAAVLHVADPGARAAWARTVDAWRPWALVGAVAALGLVLLWGRVLRGGTVRWILAAVASALVLLAVAMLREALRLDALGPEAYAARHEAAFGRQGLAVFLAFAVLGVGVLVWIRRMVVRGVLEAAPDGPEEVSR